MTINGVSGVGNVGQPTMVTGGSLSAESLLLYCSVQLNAMDTQLKAEMARQNQARSSQQVLNQVKNAIGIKSIGTNDYDRKVQILTAMRDAYQRLPPDDPARQTLQAAFETFANTACLNDSGAAAGLKLGDPNLNIHRLASLADACGRNNVDTDEMKGIQGMIDEAITDISKGAELQMINLQSLVSQRQMAIQLTTSLMTKFNDGLQAIVSSFK